MSLLPWPRSLFGRLALLLIAMLLVGQAAAIYLFRLDRAALIERQFSDTKLVELRSLRATLASLEPGASDAALTRIGEAYHARIIPDQPRRPGLEAERRFAAGPLSPLLVELEQRLKAELGPETELRIQPRLQLLWIKLVAADRAYWAGFPLPTRSGENVPSRALQWSVVILAVLLPSAYGFARYLARPLRQLSAAVASVGEGKSPPPLPETGPSEIVNLNRGFNQMMSNLSQMEQDRAVLLAGVSHDLRTPLARLRLGIEVATADERTRQGMVEDIDEMDRIISQFLDFARPGGDGTVEICDPGEIVASVAARHQRNGHDVRFARAELPKAALRATAFERMVGNLVDNALRHGTPPVELTTQAAGGNLIVEVADHGGGIRAEDMEYLKRPFTRGDPARGGAPGAGLGLAIVERIARLHGGALDLAPRSGGGLLARVTIPLAGAA